MQLRTTAPLEVSIILSNINDRRKYHDSEMNRLPKIKSNVADPNGRENIRVFNKYLKSFKLLMSYRNINGGRSFKATQKIIFFVSS